jgi:hypothetical protein
VTVEHRRRAVAAADLQHLRDVGGQVLDRDGGVLDERLRLARPRHGGVDAEALAAELDHLALLARRDRQVGGVGAAAGGRIGGEAGEVIAQLAVVVAVELHAEHGGGVALHPADVGGEGRVGGRQREHVAVDQLDGARTVAHDGGHRLERRDQGVEVQQRQHAPARDRVERQGDVEDGGQRPLAAAQELGEVERTIRGAARRGGSRRRAA